MKADQPGRERLCVRAFLSHVRRLVVQFVVQRLLAREDSDAQVEKLDPVSTYYLLHRHDFGLADAPAGACILYTLSCGLSDSDLATTHDLIVRGGSSRSTRPAADTAPAEDDAPGGSGTLKLKNWHQRKLQPFVVRTTVAAKDASHDAPLVDHVHHLMQLWSRGDAAAVDSHLDEHGLRRRVLFPQLLQALVELAPAGGEERAMLESIFNHVRSRGEEPQTLFSG